MKIKRVFTLFGPPIIGLFILVVIGTTLFSIFENISLFDAFY